MSQWQPEYRPRRRGLTPPAVPPQFTRPRRPVRDLLATAPGQLRALGYQATQQVRLYRSAAFTAAQPGWRPGPHPQPAVARREQPRFFLRTLLLVQVSFTAWIATGLTLNHVDQVGPGSGLLTVAGIWLGLDIALGLGYGVYRLTSRR